MKDFILKSKVLLFILILGTAFSCGKEKTKTIFNEEFKNNTNNSVSERGDCCGSIKFYRLSGKPFTISFKVWYLNNSGVWVSTSCTSPAGQDNYTFNFCHDSNSPLLYYLEPCGAISAADWSNIDFGVITTNACGMVKVWGACCCKAINYGTTIFPVQVNGSSTFIGWNVEVSLCCN